MKILKTVLVAGALAAAALTTTAADAATRIVVGNNHARVVTTRPMVHRAPIAVFGGWYAEPGVYRPYAFYRANHRLRACFLVTQRGFQNGHRALISATMCYGKNGVRFIVPASHHVVRWF